MSQNAILRIAALGSGSAGNALCVTDGVTTILVDCGFSAKETTRRLRCMGVEPASVSAILVTHEHIDHVSGIEVFCRRHAPEATVYATPGTRRAADLPSKAARCAEVSRMTPFTVGSFEVLPFAISHDAAEPVGYRISTEEHSVGIATDTGVLTEQASQALSGCEYLGIECNYDAAMLAAGPYPAYLKNRIRSCIGHLSNAAGADALATLAHDGLKAVLALHCSRTNNTAGLAGSALTGRLREIGLPEVPVAVASQIDVCALTHADRPREHPYP